MTQREPRTARILIVDDHEDNVELLRARLEAWGYAHANRRPTARRRSQKVDDDRRPT